MNSKTLKYLSYSIIFLALILFSIFNLLAHFKINMLVFMLTTVIISYSLKKMALKKAITKNRDTEYIEAIEKEVNTAKWAGIMLLGLAVVDAICRYS